MSGEIEVTGDALTGGLVSGAVEHALNPGGGQHDATHRPCPNCGSMLAGPYCAQCGQPAHIHRTLHSLGHDILHGVFHFEGKIWRTLPELAFRPGRLTRRFIDGERAKFVSPMALFLFTVFLMFAVFGFTGGALLGGDVLTIDGKKIPLAGWKAGLKEEYNQTVEDISTLQKQRNKPDITATEREHLDAQIKDKADDRDVIAGLAMGDLTQLTGRDTRDRAQRFTKAAKDNEGATMLGGTYINSGWAAFDSSISEGLKHANENPQLLLYKLKTSGYKYSWALIPLSVPFLWMLFFWRRDVHLYDHAIFSTYSISFMMLLVVLLSLVAVAGVGAPIWATALILIPPLHMYKQLRGTYRLSRLGAAIRLLFLMASAVMVLMLFSLILLALGVLQ